MNVFDRWKELVFDKDQKLAERYFREMERDYNEKGRHYHTFRHIEQLLDLSERFKHLLKNRMVIDLAIFYHDVVYRAGRNDNEVESAAAAEYALGRLKFPLQIIASVSHYILATRNHLSKVLDDTDLEYFLDFDLSILSSDPEDYKQYAKQVREEYASLPDVFYNAGRISFLEKTLLAPNLYYTEEFRKNESKARTNMGWELELLRKG